MSAHRHTGRIARWLAGRAYALGVISGSSMRYDSSTGCKGCTKVFWRGRRSYVLGWPLVNWRCSLAFHHWPTQDKIAFGFCTKCLPCGDCGSAEAWHRCEVQA